MSTIEELINELSLPEPTYYHKIYPKETGYYKGRQLVQGETIKCRFCGRDDRWMSSDKAMICDSGKDEHAPTWIGWGHIHTVDSISKSFIGHTHCLQDDEDSLEGGTHAVTS